MTKKDMREPRYSLQEMIIYLICIFLAGGWTGGMVQINPSSSDTLQRIERKVETLSRDVSDLKEQIQEIKLIDKIKKKQ